MTGKENTFGLKYENEESITEKPNDINKMEKELEGLEEGPKVKIYSNSHEQKSKNDQIGKRQAVMAYTVTALKIHFNPRLTGYRND